MMEKSARLCAHRCAQHACSSKRDFWCFAGKIVDRRFCLERGAKISLSCQGRAENSKRKNGPSGPELKPPVRAAASARTQTLHGLCRKNHDGYAGLLSCCWL